MDKEIWKDVVGYEGFYQVSNLGRVKSLARSVVGRNESTRSIKEKIKKASLCRKGYLTVCLSKNKSQKIYKVHQLVAMAFLNHKPCGHRIVVHHRNNIRTDNRVDNLELVSNRYNLSVDKWRKGKTSKYTGVCLKGYYADGNPKWIAGIRINSEKKHLGHFRSEDEAGKAYQEALSRIN